jgi:hypothetical protein
MCILISSKLSIYNFCDYYDLQLFILMVKLQKAVDIHTTLTVQVNTCKTNSVVLVRKQTIPTERPQPTGEVSAIFS